MNTQSGKYHPSLSLYHPNAKGTGSAVRMILHPATSVEEGFLEMRMANQLIVGSGGTFPQFDWENEVDISLSFCDICHILQVFRGETESINDGRGLLNQTDSRYTVIRMRHMLEPTVGYRFEVSVKTKEDGLESNRCIFFTYPEALGICESLSSSLCVVAFGKSAVM